MSRKTILHMLTPLRHMSPFDANMALDAGYDAVIPYTDVGLADVGNLVQDAIFSRPPDAGVATGIFLAGKDAPLALDMLDVGEKIDGPALRNLGIRRSGGVIYHRRGNGCQGRESADQAP